MCPLRVTLPTQTHMHTIAIRNGRGVKISFNAQLSFMRLSAISPVWSGADFHSRCAQRLYARIPHSPAFCTLGVINFSTPLPAGREGKEACKILRPRANATRSVVQSSATHNRYIYLVPRFANVQRQGLDRANKTTNRRDMMLHQRRGHTGGGTDTTESRPPDGTLFDRLRFRVGNIFLSSVRSVWLRLSRTHRIRFAHPAQNRALKGLSCCRSGRRKAGEAWWG